MTHDPKLTLELRLSAWGNIFHVLHELGLGEMSARRGEVYRKEHGEFFSSGGFWAQIQALEAQIEHWRELNVFATEVTKPGAEKMCALRAGHPAVGELCNICGEKLLVGQVPAFLGQGPADKKQAVKAKIGQAYTAACVLVHQACVDRAASGGMKDSRKLDGRI